MAISSRIIAAIILMIQSISSLTLLRPEEAPLPPVRPINPGTNQQAQPYYTGETLIFYGNQDPHGLPYRPPSSQQEGPYTPGAPFQGPPFTNPVNPPPGAPFTGPPFDSQTPPKYIFNPNNPGIPQSPQQPQPQPFPVYPPPQQQSPVGGYPPQQPQAPPKPVVNPAAPQRPLVPIPRPDAPSNPQTPQKPPPPPPAQEPKDVPPFAPRPEQPAPKGPIYSQPPPQTPGIKDGSASGPSVGSGLGSGSGSGSSRPAGAAGGPIVNAEQDLNNKLDTHQIDVGDKPLIFSKPSQFIIGTLAAFFGLCTLMRCYSKLCWDKSGGRAGGDNGGGNGYDKGAPVSRQNGSIEADVDWSDHTQDEFEEDEDDEENVMTDVQQCRSRKAREMVPDDSATFSDQDRLGIEQGDVNIIMEEEEEENINDDKECVMTDDETRAIMREFKDTDDEYVD